VLDEQKINTPTPIQSMAAPELLKGKSALLTAQTGTGKTLAYALPLIHNLKMQELNSGIRLTVPHRPRNIGTTHFLSHFCTFPTVLFTCSLTIFCSGRAQPRVSNSS